MNLNEAKVIEMQNKFNEEVYNQLQAKRKDGSITIAETDVLQEMCKEKLFTLMESPEIRGVFERLKNR
jgi:hypothetical protein